MTEFSEIQKYAKHLSKSLANSYTKQQGCLCFFSVLIPQLTNNCAWKDACMIETIAESLDVIYDNELFNFYKSIYKPSNLLDSYLEFKAQILKGAYVLIWSRYNNSVVSYLNKPLIEHFQTILDIQSPAELSAHFLKRVLTALSQYCSFVYQNRSKIKIYEEVNMKFGDAVQADILGVFNLKFAEDNSWQGFCKGLMESFGINMS